MSALIKPDSPALEAAKDYAFQLGLTLSAEQVRWIIEAFLDAESDDDGIELEREA